MPKLFNEQWKRHVPLLVGVIAFLTVIVIPMKIIGYGFLPADDSLRHAAQGVSGKDWSQVMVLGSPIKIDYQFGWDLIQRRLFDLLHCSAESLVEISIVSLYIIFAVSAMLCLKRPEAWLGALFLNAVAGNFPARLLLGRPFMLTMSALAVILIVWRNRAQNPPRKRDVALMALLIGAACFIHGTWYLWVLPVAAFFLARQFRWGIAMTAGWVLGVALAAVATGHPITYVVEAVRVAIQCVGSYATPGMLVGELQPYMSFNALLILASLAAIRQVVKIPWQPLLANPATWLMGMGWILGCKTGRFWFDWGAPALMVLIAIDLQTLLAAYLPYDSLRRLVCAGAIALATYAAITSDFGSRWTNSLHNQYLTQDDPAVAGWLPDKGGIFYCSDMQFFNQTYMKNPNADWKYILGFEPTLMPADDFAIYHRIIWNYGDDSAYDGWVKKMRLEDRLVLTQDGGPPRIPGLEWNRPVKGYWIGRLPRTNAVPGATVPTKPKG